MLVPSVRIAPGALNVRSIDSAPTHTLRAGLDEYLRANNLPPDGGNSERWAVVRLGPMPIAYLNVAARRAVVPFHDLHHVVTGYPTDLQGESQIAAWELGSGCGRYWFAWLINLGAIASGLHWPVRTLRAFARGRQSQNLFGWDYDDALAMSVSDLRSRLGLDGPTMVRATDLVIFIGLLPAAGLSGAAVVAWSFVTAPWWLKAGVHRQRRLPASPPQQ